MTALRVRNRGFKLYCKGSEGCTFLVVSKILSRVEEGCSVDHFYYLHIFLQLDENSYSFLLHIVLLETALRDPLFVYSI